MTGDASTAPGRPEPAVVPEGGRPGTPAPASQNDPPVSWNAAANTASFAVSIVATFFLTPFVIATLGDERYGTWTLIAQVTGYYALLDFGTRMAVGYFVARLGARGEPDQMNHAVSTAFFTLACAGAVVAGIGVTLAFVLPGLLGVPSEFVSEARLAMVILSVTVGLTLPFDVWAAAVNGCRRNYIVSLTEMVVRVLTSIAIAVALAAGGGLAALALTQLGGKVIVWGTAYRYTRLLLPALVVRPAMWTRSWLSEIGKFGGGTFVINMAALVINRLDLLIVGTVLGMAHVTYYAVAQTLTSYVSSAVANITQAFTMHFAHLHSLGDQERLRRMYLNGTRMAAAVAVLISGYVFVFGSSFLRLWLGDRFVTGDWYHRSDVVLAILLVAKLPFYLQGISRQLLLGARKLRFLSTVQVGEAMLNLVLSLILVRHLGLAGVAIGTLIPTLITNLLIIPPYMRRELGFGFGELLREGLFRSVATGATITLIAYLIVTMVPPTTWAAFFGDALLSALFGLVGIYTVVLTASERSSARTAIRRRLGRSVA